jgi:hypothetical protein
MNGKALSSHLPTFVARVLSRAPVSRLSQRESIDVWRARINLEAKQVHLDAFQQRQRRALRAWKVDRWIHGALMTLGWTAIVLVILLAVIGLDVVCHLFSLGGR